MRESENLVWQLSKVKAILIYSIGRLSKFYKVFNIVALVFGTAISYSFNLYLGFSSSSFSESKYICFSFFLFFFYFSFFSNFAIGVFCFKYSSCFFYILWIYSYLHLSSFTMKKALLFNYLLSAELSPYFSIYSKIFMVASFIYFNICSLLYFFFSWG